VDSIAHIEVSICEFNDAYIEMGIVVGHTANGRFCCP
jgi:hypothetical protein